MFALIVIATTIWMTYDAAHIGYDKHDVDGFGAMGPAGWFVCGLLLWIVAFPLYLIKRPALKAAAERRRLQMQTFAGALPGAVYPPGYGQPPYGQPNPYGAPPPGYPPPGYAGHPGHGGHPPAYGAPPPPGYPPQHGAPPPPGYPPQGYAPPHGAPPPQGAGQAQPGQAQGHGGSTGTLQGPPPPNAAPGARAGTGAAPGQPLPAPQNHAGSSQSMTAGDLAEGIRQLTELRDRGLLTEAEFQSRKNALLTKV